MATFTQRSVTTLRREFVVPAGPYGAPAAEIGKAWAAAERGYRSAHKISDADPLPDNAIVFRPGDDEIVISFDTSAETQP